MSNEQVLIEMQKRFPTHHLELINEKLFIDGEEVITEWTPLSDAEASLQVTVNERKIKLNIEDLLLSFIEQDIHLFLGRG